MSSQVAGAVVVDSWAAKSMARNAALVLGLTAIQAGLTYFVSVTLPFTPVPLTLQTFAVLAGAAALGAERAVISQILYLLLAVAGLPILAERSSGLDAVVGATGGYLLGFIVASYVVGRIAERGATRKVASTVLAYVAGSAVIYTLGAIWLAYSTSNSISWAIANGVAPFLVGDAIKAVAAGAVLPAAWKLVDGK